MALQVAPAPFADSMAQAMVLADAYFTQFPPSHGGAVQYIVNVRTHTGQYTPRYFLRGNWNLGIGEWYGYSYPPSSGSNVVSGGSQSPPATPQPPGGGQSSPWLGPPPVIQPTPPSEGEYIPPSVEPPTSGAPPSFGEPPEPPPGVYSPIGTVIPGGVVAPFNRIKPAPHPGLPVAITPIGGTRTPVAIRHPGLATPIDTDVRGYAPAIARRRVVPNRSVFLADVTAGGPFGNATLGELGIVVQSNQDQPEPVVPPVASGRPEGLVPDTQLPFPPKEAEIRSKGTWQDEDGAWHPLPSLGRLIRKLLDCDEGKIRLRVGVAFSYDIKFREFSLSDAENKLTPSSSEVTKSIGEIMKKAFADEEGVRRELTEGICVRALIELKARARPVPKDNGSRESKETESGPPGVLDAEVVCLWPCRKLYSVVCDQVEIHEGPTWFAAREAHFNGNTTFAIKAHFAGLVYFTWTIRCVRYPGIPEPGNLEEAKKALFGTSESGRPLGGHAQPPQVPPPEETPIPDDCCCVVEQVSIKPNPTPIWEVNEQFGHRFVVVIKYWFRRGRPEQDCVLKWWEFATLTPPWLQAHGWEDNKWIDGHANFPVSAVFDGWRRRKRPLTAADCHTSKPEDDELLTAELVDVPASAWVLPDDYMKKYGGQRHAWIKVEVFNGCEGNDPPKSACVYQHLRIEDQGGGKLVRSGRLRVLNQSDCELMRTGESDPPSAPSDAGLAGDVLLPP